MSSGNEPSSFPSKASSSASYLPMGPITGNGPSLQRPHSIPHQSDPLVGSSTENGRSFHRLHSTTPNSDPSMWPKTENGPSLQRPRSISRHSDPSMGVTLDNGPSSPYRPHSQSHHSDPGDLRYLKSAPTHMVSSPSLHHAESNPDLRSPGSENSFSHHYQQRVINDMNHHYRNPDYQHASARDFPPRLDSEVEVRGRLVSRSLSDLSTLGNDAGFLSHSPTTLQRTFAYPNYEAKTFYFQSNETPEIYNGEYILRSSGSVPDLSASYPPFNTPYRTPHSGRASPTPSQYSDFSSFSSYATELSPRSAFMQSRSRLSDNSLSLNDRGYIARENGSTSGLQRYDRETEYFRSKSETPSSFGRGQSSTITSSSPRSVDYSSRRKIPVYKSSTQQSSLQGSDSTTRDDANRTSNSEGRERSSTLSRTLSLSNLGEEKKQSLPSGVSEKRRDSLPLSVESPREKYPLAKVPIPSFREFKQKNLERNSKLSNTLGGKKVAKEDEHSKSPKSSAKHDSKRKADMRSALKERLSSMYESSKDISAQNATKRLTESYKLNSSGEVKIKEPMYIVKSTELTEAKHDEADAVKETKTSRKISKGRQESPFSKNEVIHQLMLKYGLYDKEGHRKSRSPKNETKEGLSGGNNSDVKEGSCENESKRKLSSRGKEKVTVESEKNWRNSTDHSNRSTTKSSSVSQREDNQSVVNESKKSAAERFRELRRKNGIRNDIVGDVREDTSKGNLTKVSSSEKIVKEKGIVAKSSGQNLDASVADVMKGRTLAVKSKISEDEACSSPSDADSDSPRKTKNAVSLRGTSRAVLCATKFKRNKGSKSPGESPLPSKKQLADIVGTSEIRESENTEANNSANCIDVKRNSSLDKPSPNTRRRRFRGERGLRRGGIHTSMLSVASSAPSDTEMDDTVSIYGDTDSLDDERGTRGRRWESFHSNISADSGSAHLFEFETDSNATECDEVFDDQDSEGKTSC